MLIKEYERLLRTARDLRGSMLLETVKAWRKGEVTDETLLEDARTTVEGVKAVRAQLDALTPPEPEQPVIIGKKPEQPKEKSDAKA